MSLLEREQSRNALPEQDSSSVITGNSYQTENQKREEALAKLYARHRRTKARRDIRINMVADTIEEIRRYKSYFGDPYQRQVLDKFSPEYLRGTAEEIATQWVESPINVKLLHLHRIELRNFRKRVKLNRERSESHHPEIPFEVRQRKENRINRLAYRLYIDRENKDMIGDARERQMRETHTPQELADRDWQKAKRIVESPAAAKGLKLMTERRRELKNQVAAHKARQEIIEKMVYAMPNDQKNKTPEMAHA